MSFSDLYPERRGDTKQMTLIEKVGVSQGGYHDSLKARCSNYVIDNVEKAPMIRTMLAALKSLGCGVDMTKQISCEMCETGTDVQHYGGYDEKYNQVFLCANNCSEPGEVHGALLRNLFYMFDRCVNKYDFNNPDHLACTEIRKANLADCTYMTYLNTVGAQLGVKREHANCVKLRAEEALIKSRFVPKEMAKASIEKVFDRCYKDLEPIGRRVKNVEDMKMSHDEKFLYGYHGKEDK